MSKGSGGIPVTLAAESHDEYMARIRRVAEKVPYRDVCIFNSRNKRRRFRDIMSENPPGGSILKIV